MNYNMNRSGFSRTIPNTHQVPQRHAYIPRTSEISTKLSNHIATISFPQLISNDILEKDVKLSLNVDGSENVFEQIMSAFAFVTRHIGSKSQHLSISKVDIISLCLGTNNTFNETPKIYQILDARIIELKKFAIQNNIQSKREIIISIEVSNPFISNILGNRHSTQSTLSISPSERAKDDKLTNVGFLLQPPDHKLSQQYSARVGTPREEYSHHHSKSEGISCKYDSKISIRIKFISMKDSSVIVGPISAGLNENLKLIVDRFLSRFAVKNIVFLGKKIDMMEPVGKVFSKMNNMNDLFTLQFY